MLILNVAVWMDLFWWPPCSIGLCGASGSSGLLCLGIGPWRSELVEVNKHICMTEAPTKRIRRFIVLLSTLTCCSLSVGASRLYVLFFFYIFTILNILITVSKCISRSSGRLPPLRLFSLRSRLLVIRHRLSASQVFVVHRLV